MRTSRRCSTSSRSTATSTPKTSESRTDTIAKQPGAKPFDVPNNGWAVQNSSSPTSVYVAYPDEKRFEVEVYDPDPAKALDLVKSGDIQPVP